ncbi:MAG: hypothetical protein QG622_3495 [Actinomycetota bacterium]|nr:hypothetical protein [Actinomycetota bacterium]
MTRSDADAARWREANLAFTECVVDELLCRLTDRDDLSEKRAARTEAARACDPPPALDTLADAFGLTDFERDLLALAVAAELRPQVRQACGALTAASSCGPSFALASRVLDAPHWSALSPGRPLRSAGLIELGGGPLPDASIHPVERVLHHLLGVDDLDAALAVTSTWLPGAGELVASHEHGATEVLRAWCAGTTDPSTDRWPTGSAWPIVHVEADRDDDGRQVAARAATLAGCLAHVVRPADLLTNAAGRAALTLAWRRELVLRPRLLVVDLTGPDLGQHDRGALATFLDAVIGPVVVLGPVPPGTMRGRRQVRVNFPGEDEQRSAWAVSLRRHLDGAARGLGPDVERAIGQFRLGAAEIEDVAADLAAEHARAAGSSGDLGARLWNLCRSRSRPSLDVLARRVVTRAGWDDLVLPAPETETLRTIARHVAHRSGVQRAWGHGAGTRGCGVTALFHGPSGTGKTLAAEVVATEIGLDLYRIDLSAVVSKYIGETEKNLRQVFDAAESSGAVLLFDEADALFGKRTEVRDSHDRFANIEVSYLLSRMETYRGLAILTTNARSALDAAFLRRLRFIVAFPFPDETQRARIWRHVFPATLPTEGLDPERLARLGVSGATIHSIALHASYEAAADGGPVTVEHLRLAAARELAKLDKPLSHGELAALR